MDLTDDALKPRPAEPGSSSSVVDFINEELEENDQDNNGQVYLNNVDSVIKEIKEKAEQAAANSPILNGSDSPLLSRKGIDTLLFSVTYFYFPFLSYFLTYLLCSKI